MASMVQNQQDALAVTPGGLNDCWGDRGFVRSHPEETVLEEAHANLCE